MQFGKMIAVLTAALAMSACATSDKVQVQQLADDRLSCMDIKLEFLKLDQAQRDIEAKKGVTGTNVAAALFWIPGLAYTYYDAGQAEQSIRDRRSHLAGLHKSKRC